MSDLDDILNDRGLTAKDLRPPLQYDSTFPVSKKIGELEQELKESGQTELLEDFSKAFSIIKLSSVFDIFKANIPQEYTKSGIDLLNWYIGKIMEGVDGNPEMVQELQVALKRLLSLAIMYGYLLRALEHDGRWDQVDKLK